MAAHDAVESMPIFRGIRNHGPENPGHPLKSAVSRSVDRAIKHKRKRSKRRRTRVIRRPNPSVRSRVTAPTSRNVRLGRDQTRKGV